MIERLFLPDGLAGMAAGPELGMVLAGIDAERLNGYDLVVVMQAWARQLSYTQERFSATVWEVSICPPGPEDAPVEREPVGNLMDEFAACEVAAALHLTRHSAEVQLGLAAGLHYTPQVAAALSAGTIDLARAKVLFDGGLNDLPPDTREAVLTEALRLAPELTSGQLRAKLATLAHQADPDLARRRYREGVSERRLNHGRCHQGTGYLSGVDLPTDRAAAALANINDIAQTLKRGGDERTMDQLRADVYLDLLEGVTHPTGAPAGTVDLVVPLTTLIGLGDDPGQIPGWGPVIGEVARQTAAAAPTWRYRLTDEHGRLLHRGLIPRHARTGKTHIGTTRRVSQSSVAGEYAFVKARDQHCRYPGCRVPMRACDVDHTVQRQHGGSHTRDNLAVVCRHHHRAKDEGGYRLRQHGHGHLEWTTPLGHTYHTDPG